MKRLLRWMLISVGVCLGLATVGIGMGQLQSTEKRVSAHYQIVNYEVLSRIYLFDTDKRLRILLLEVRKVNMVDLLEMAWSPDGEQLAFVSTHSSNVSLELLKLAEPNRLHRLTDNRFIGVNVLFWSSDSTKIVFTGSTARHEFNLYRVDIDSGEIVQLTHSDWHDWSPVWRRRS